MTATSQFEMATCKTKIIPKGVISLKADNGNFWRVVRYSDRDNIEAANCCLDFSCQFIVVPASGGKVYITTPQNKYLSRIHRGGIDYIEPAKDRPDVACEFLLCIKNEKVFFLADNEKYLSRFDRGVQNIEAAKEKIDVYCLFEVDKFQHAVAPEGVIALMADNGNFWSVVHYSNRDNIEAAKSSLDSSCQFKVVPVSDGKVYITTLQNKYLSRIQRSGINYIEPAKDKPDVACEFQLNIKEGKVFFMADNGNFLSRFDRGKQNIEAAKEQIDVYCLFEVVHFIEPKML